MSLRIENNRNLAHFTVVASMQRARVSNAWQPFNGPISRVNLPLFTLIVRKCKENFWNIHRAILDMGFFKKRQRKHNGNKNERKCDNRNVA